MNNSYTLNFNEIDKNSISMVGGKGANLGELTAAGFVVPDGYCVTTEAFKRFVIYNELEQYISGELKKIDINNIDEIGVIGQQIRDRIVSMNIPYDVTNSIVEAWKECGEDNFYAVRSSATAEDLAFQSFAGQQDTYLNIKGKEQLLSAIRSCWASLYTDRAIIYRMQNNIDHERVLMSVVVQKMVLPQISGIMFTADPVSGHRGVISIDASYGLGEALVSGLVSADIYKFDKKNDSVLNKVISEKKIAIMPLKEGGTERVDIPEKQRKLPVLNDEQVKTLANIGMKIEKHYGCPQDIEWCLEDGKFYIVQSRAITSLYPLPSPIPKDNDLHVCISFNHLQVMTAPISPLGISLLMHILPFDRGTKGDDEFKFGKSAAGRIFIDLSLLLQFEKARKNIPKLIKNADELIGLALQEVVDRPDFAKRIKKDRGIVKKILGGLVPILLNGMTRIWFRKPEGTVEFSNKYIESSIAESKKSVENAAQGVEKLKAVYNLTQMHQLFPIFLPRIFAGVVSFRLLAGFSQKWLGTTKQVDTIVKGLEGNVTTEMGLKVGDLADIARKYPAVIKELENSNYSSLIMRIEKLKNCDEFKNAFKEFISKYGMRAASEIDIATPRWEEDPEALVCAILSNLRTSSKGSHRAHYKELIQNAGIAAEELIKEVRKTKYGILRARIVKRLIRVCRNVFPVREHPKYLIMQLGYIFKKAMLNEGDALVSKGLLNSREDVFYVTFEELYKAVEVGESLVELVEKRKEDYQHYKKLSPPRVITSDGEEIKAGYTLKDAPEGALIGVGVSSGVVEGIARVISNPKGATLNKGEILVAPYTDPGWTPLFINAAGLVMEIGGLLTHGTVVAREYGIPAVVGIEGATKKIKSGQRIRVNGDVGYVEVIG